MGYLTRILINTALAGLLILFIGACAKPHYLNVKYDLPETSDQLQGQKVRLVVEDLREDKTIFSDEAGSEFKQWDGTFSLALGGITPPEPVETYDLPTLFHEAMKNRLEAMQIEIVDVPAGEAPTFIVTLEKISIDLKGRTWHAQIAYKVQLSRDSSKIARESVSGSAERTKVMGKGGGEKLIGEMFTEGVNKLNISKLFENAGLL